MADSLNRMAEKERERKEGSNITRNEDIKTHPKTPTKGSNINTHFEFLTQYRCSKIRQKHCCFVGYAQNDR